MTENVFTPHTEPQAEPTLHRNLALPKGALQDNTDSNVQELKNQLQAERQNEQQATMAAAAMGDSALASATPQQRAAATVYGPTGVAVPCIPGQPCLQAQQGNLQMQLTPVQQQAQ